MFRNNSNSTTLSLDTTFQGQYPVTFTHSNNYSSSDVYGSGSVLIQTTGTSNNQPVLILEKNNNTNTLTNSPNLVLNNTGGIDTSTSLYGVSIDLTCNNNNVNTYNGKTRINQLCGNSAGTANLRDGYLQISPRNSANTAYESIFRFLPATTVGLGLFETSGNGIAISPIRDFTSASKIELINTFQSTIITNQATAATKTAIIENDGQGSSYIRTRSRTGTASILLQSDANNASSTIELRSNQISGSGGLSHIKCYNNPSDNSGARFGADVFGGFRVERMASGVETTVMRCSPGLDRTIFQKISSSKQGSIRLGDGTGIVGGGNIDYSSDVGNFNFDKNLNITGNCFPTNDSTFTCGLAVNAWSNTYSDVYTTTSDFNKKKDISKLTLSLDFLNEIETYNYTLKKSERKSMGVMAQDIEKLAIKHNIPQGTLYDNQDGNYFVMYQEFIPILINAIKELSQQVKDLSPKVKIRKTK